MPDTIKTGNILIKEGIEVPHSSSDPWRRSLFLLCPLIGAKLIPKL